MGAGQGRRLLRNHSGEHLLRSGRRVCHQADRYLRPRGEEVVVREDHSGRGQQHPARGRLHVVAREGRGGRTGAVHRPFDRRGRRGGGLGVEIRNHDLRQAEPRIHLRGAGGYGGLADRDRQQERQEHQDGDHRRGPRRHQPRPALVVPLRRHEGRLCVRHVARGQPRRRVCLCDFDGLFAGLLHEGRRASLGLRHRQGRCVGREQQRFDQGAVADAFGRRGRHGLRAGGLQRAEQGCGRQRVLRRQRRRRGRLAGLACEYGREHQLPVTLAGRHREISLHCGAQRAFGASEFPGLRQIVGRPGGRATRQRRLLRRRAAAQKRHGDRRYGRQSRHARLLPRRRGQVEILLREVERPRAQLRRQRQGCYVRGAERHAACVGSRRQGLHPVPEPGRACGQESGRGCRLLL